jgi:hypothetical protein
MTKIGTSFPWRIIRLLRDGLPSEQNREAQIGEKRPFHVTGIESACIPKSGSSPPGILMQTDRTNLNSTYHSIVGNGVESRRGKKKPPSKL